MRTTATWIVVQGAGASGIPSAGGSPRTAGAPARTASTGRSRTTRRARPARCTTSATRSTFLYAVRFLGSPEPQGCGHALDRVGSRHIGHEPHADSLRECVLDRLVHDVAKRLRSPLVPAVVPGQ